MKSQASDAYGLTLLKACNVSVLKSPPCTLAETQRLGSSCIALGPALCTLPIYICNMETRPQPEARVCFVTWANYLTFLTSDSSLRSELESS